MSPGGAGVLGGLGLACAALITLAAPATAADAAASPAALAAAEVVARVVTEPPVAGSELELEMGGVRVALGHGEEAADADVTGERYIIVAHPTREQRLLDVACLDGMGRPAAMVLDASADAVTLRPRPGTTTTCTFLVEARVATVRTTIDAGPEPVEATFTLQLPDDEVELHPGDLVTDDDARADLYRMALLPDPAFRLLDIVCRPTGGGPADRLPAETDLAAWTVALAPGIGASVDCTFLVEALDDERSPGVGTGQSSDGLGTLDGDGDEGDDDADRADRGRAGDDLAEVPLLPRAGAWRAVNLPATMRCAGQAILLDRTVDRGRIQVRDGGRLIIARGIAEGQRRPIRLRLVDADAATYRGSIRLSAAGRTLTPAFEMRVITPERIEAVLSGRVDIGGRSCRLRRDVRLDRLGG